MPAHGLAIPGGRLRAGPVYRAMLFLAVLLSVRSRPAWLARAVRPCPCDVPLPAAQPPSQHGAVVAWDRDQAGGSGDAVAPGTPLHLRITVFARGSPAHVQCSAPGRLWWLGAAGAPFYRNSASVVSAAGVFNCSVSAATPWHLGHRCIFGLRSSREALRRTCSVLHQVGCYGWAQPTLPSAGILGRR